MCNLVALVYVAAAGRHLERHPEVVVTSRAKQIEVRSENATIIGGGTVDTVGGGIIATGRCHSNLP